MKTAKNSLDNSFVPLFTFIEYRKKLMQLKTKFNIRKKSSVVEARNILDTYMKKTQKLSDDILKMREE
jgi:hypothetical protein